LDWKHLDERFGGAICIPATCSSKIVPALMQQIFNGTDLVIARDYDQEAYCQIRENKMFSLADFAIM
jgi:hypothetical protein